MYIEKVLDLCVQLMKNGGKNTSVAFINLVSVCIYTVYIYIFIRDGTIHLTPDSILSRYLGADTICIAFFFKNFDSTSISIRYCYVAIFVFNSRPWEKVE